VLTAAGVEHGSELSIAFEPSYERVTLHAITLHRGGARIDALRAADVRLLRRETELDRRLYDGRVTIHVILKGVRVGDVVEYAYTLRGENPVYGGRYADHEPLAFGVPVGKLVVRLLWPADRTLRVRTHGGDLEPSVTRRAGEVEYRWERSELEAVEYEGDLPAGIDEEPWLQLSEWSAWSDVARWAVAISPPADVPPALAGEVRRWRALPDDEARARAALRFVQDEIRYLGIEMGAHSHRPHAPALVIDRRYGDCKDKSLLLVALLRGMGIEADAALVSTDAGTALDRRLPSPVEFDHVVVRTSVGGRVHWLDPTRSLERGDLSSRAPPAYGRALLVRDGTASLVPLPEAVPSRVEVETTFAVARFGQPGALTVRTRLGGQRATSLRNTLASTPRADLAKDYLDYYARLYPSIETAAPLEIRDDDDSGEVVVVERYRVPPVRPGDERDFAAESISSELTEPGTVLRRLPLGLDHPVDVRETIRVELPGPPDLDPERQTFRSAGAEFSRDIDVRGNALVADFRYRTTKGALEPSEVSAFVASMREMRAHAGFTIPLRVRRGRAAGEERDPVPVGIVAAVAVGVLAAFAGVKWVSDGGLRAVALLARKRAFARRFVTPEGDAPATAIEVRVREEMRQRAERVRCPCGARLLAGAPPDAVRYDGREVFVLALRCDRCGASRPMYFTMRG
jgi:transglutaminase-like putative cysteine protease